MANRLPEMTPEVTRQCLEEALDCTVNTVALLSAHILRARNANHISNDTAYQMLNRLAIDPFSILERRHS